jgi:hypothetical protein
MTNLITVVLPKGTALRVELSCTDGAFEIHFDTEKHKNCLVVEEVDDIADSSGRAGILYCERFASVPDEDASDASDDEFEDPNSSDNVVYTFALRSDNDHWFDPEQLLWVPERTQTCECSDFDTANALRDKVWEAEITTFKRTSAIEIVAREIVARSKVDVET